MSTPTVGRLTGLRSSAGRTLWLVLDQDGQTTTIAAAADEPGGSDWTRLLATGDAVAVIRCKPSNKYPATWTGRLAPLNAQPQPTWETLAARCAVEGGDPEVQDWGLAGLSAADPWRREQLDLLASAPHHQGGVR